MISPPQWEKRFTGFKYLTTTNSMANRQFRRMTPTRRETFQGKNGAFFWRETRRMGALQSEKTQGTRLPVFHQCFARNKQDYSTENYPPKMKCRFDMLFFFEDMLISGVWGDEEIQCFCCCRLFLFCRRNTSSIRGRGVSDVGLGVAWVRCNHGNPRFLHIQGL